MLPAIAFLGLAFIFAGLLAFYKALDLIPTDLGLSWFMGGFTLFAAGGVVLAIAMATKVLRDSSRQNGSVMAPLTEPAPPPGKNDDGMAGGLAKVGGVLAAGAAAGALASRLGSAVAGEAKGGDSTVPGVSDDKLLEELERDLFDEAPAPVAVEPAPAETEVPVLGPASRISTPDFDVEYTPIGSATSAALPVAGEAVEELRGPIMEADDAVRESAEDAGGDEDTVEPAIPEPAATAGLIADDDLAALSEDLPPLAPVEGLDIVGSYDSGGTRFTMYSDGSVVAAGPGGETRYRNLDELRSAIDGGGKSA